MKHNTSDARGSQRLHKKGNIRTQGAHIAAARTKHEGKEGNRHTNGGEEGKAISKKDESREKKRKSYSPDGNSNMGVRLATPFPVSFLLSSLLACGVSVLPLSHPPIEQLNY